MHRNGKIYAALTGDLVGSSRLSAAGSAGAMEILRRAADDLAAGHPRAVVGPMDTFRHDSWQLLLEQPALAVRAALFFRTALKLESDAGAKYDTRVSIGIGPVELISTRRISDSRGPAFTRSGKGLDAMGGRCFAIDAGDGPPEPLKCLAAAAVPLLDCIVGDWTPAESRAVNGALRGLTQEEIASLWPPVGTTGRPPSRQAVGDALARAHWRTVTDVLHWIETAI
ncbi:hypothetical protein [Desulfococcus sp.]|uniref:hypothetical protein n=1 Tax=Desulfococcus sp. TaxID=2025834 RepID=UPI0035945928